MIDNIIIRRVELKDAQILSELAAKTFFDTFDGTCSKQDMEVFLFDYYNIEQIKKELANPNDFFYFAEIDNKPVGYIRYMEDYTNYEKMKEWKALELKRLYVDKNFHGKSIAQELMKHFFDYATKNEFEVVWLGVWEFNYRAQNFYKKMGFDDTGVRHDFPIGNTPQYDIWYWKFLK